MGRVLSQFGLVSLMIGLLVSACAAPASRSDDNRQGGFYGGIGGSPPGW